MSRAVASRSKASCLRLALRNARWFESSWGKKFSHEISASVWDRCPPSIVMHLESYDRWRNPVTQTSYNGWGAHRANHTIPPFWLDDRPPLLRHVGVRPTAGCTLKISMPKLESAPNTESPLSLLSNTSVAYQMAFEAMSLESQWIPRVAHSAIIVLSAIVKLRNHEARLLHGLASLSGYLASQQCTVPRKDGRLSHSCETWTLTLREEHRLRVFENKVLRKIFGAKRDEVTGVWRKLHNAELHALYSSPDIIRNIKSRRLRWAGHVARMGESRNAYRVINMGNAYFYSSEKLLSSSLLSKNLKVRIYKTVILPLVLYGCETWTLTLREEHRLRVFENKVLRKIFGAKRDEVTGE
ncbi:hypothetical protein ANN_18294 [Periplaneta americana]|uniref:Uncharacterized protein n=1 Tax=Periplaneta americana TaxID=6978 RepID=A0ABQ8SNZ7_PERAM|nr:hypothetical protein ANN_18294 [Periplaneta americana]